MIVDSYYRGLAKLRFDTEDLLKRYPDDTMLPMWLEKCKPGDYLSMGAALIFRLADD